MTPTTQRALREAIATAIEGIEPAEDNHPSDPWKRTRQVKDCQGPGPRTFMVRFLPAVRAEDGFSGDGFDVDADLEIWTSYVGLPDDDDAPTIDDDARQLYSTLVDLRDPITNGLSPAVHVGWVYENDTPGLVWGYHLFRVRYLVADNAL